MKRDRKKYVKSLMLQTQKENNTSDMLPMSRILTNSLEFTFLPLGADKSGENCASG
jgi:hypothetical protein